MASRLEGFAELGAQLRNLKDPKQIGPTLKRGVRAGMREPQKRARALIPTGVDAHMTYKGRLVAPGFARRSIRVISKVAKGGQMAYALLGVRAEAYYAVQYVEIGTSKMAAHPWLRPAFLASKDPNIRALGTEINDWIKGIASKRVGSGNVMSGWNALRGAGEGID